MVWWNRVPVPDEVRETRDTFFRAQEIDPTRVIAGGCAHTTNVRIVSEKDAGAYIPNSDALITNQPNLFLSITAADCIPVYFFDPVQRAVGVAHAGWRGLVGGILEKVVGEMHRAYRTQSEDLQVIIGPHVKVCHFEIGEKVADRFAKENIKRRDARLFADMTNEAVSRLESTGIQKRFDKSVCTVCESDRFFSARADKKDPLEGAVASIALL